MKEKNRQQAKKNQIIRPPVVVVLGHIDHGKTSLLDQIRKTHVAEKESGGITQHIGAYQIALPTTKEEESKKITFIDTPGHEAFSAMRSRGAKVADIAILVIDAVDGIKPQTKEVIFHIKKTKIPFIVALNKIDKPEADPNKVKRELRGEDILVEDLGGKIPAVLVSAKTGQGIPDILDLILLVAEMEDLKTSLSVPAEGVIVESYLDNKRGSIATLILQNGILKSGDIVATPSTLGKIKKLEDFQGKEISKVYPAQPAVLLGLEDVSKVGEKIKVFDDLEKAKSYQETPEEKTVSPVVEASPEKKVLNLIVKSDVKGSIEAIEEIIKSIPQDKVLLQILKSQVGDVNENDLKLAKGAKAVILAFRVKMTSTAEVLSQRERIRIIKADIIYDLVEAIRKMMERTLESKIARKDLGKVRALVIFLTEKNRQIVGGKVTEGEIEKGTKIEVWREEELVGRGKLISLQRDKKDIPRLSKGQECGILYEGNVKIEQGDTLLIYKEERKKEEL